MNRIDTLMYWKDLCDKKDSKIAELEVRTTWQPIETAPIGIKFIAMYGNSVGDVYFKDELTKKEYIEEFRLCLWMPLLEEPPKETE
jgi:hypothetical protein